MSKSIDVTITLESETCCACGVVFGMESNLRRKRTNDHQDFYCPNGHGQHYTGQTEAEKLRAQLKQQEERLAWERARRQGETRRREATERSLAATKGVVTKMKKRVGNGTCPCCNRHFTDLERHMHAKHPEFADGD